MTIWVKLNPAAADVPETPTYANLTAETALAGAAVNQLPKTASVGDLAENASQVSVPVFGQTNEETLPGPTTLPGIPVQFLADWSNALQVSLRDVSVGTDIAVALKGIRNAGETVCLIQGRVSGKAQSQGPRDMTQFQFGVTPSRSVRYFDKS